VQVEEGDAALPHRALLAQYAPDVRGEGTVDPRDEALEEQVEGALAPAPAAQAAEVAQD